MTTNTKCIICGKDWLVKHHHDDGVLTDEQLNDLIAQFNADGETD